MVIAIIVAFIMGMIVAIVGIQLFAMTISGMTYDELSEFGSLGLNASANRASTLTLCTDDGRSDIMLFEKR